MVIKDSYKEIARFLFSGFIATAVDFAIYYLGLNFFPTVVAKGISFVCGGIVLYFLNKYWTFKQEDKSYTEVVRFIIGEVLAFIVNIGINELMLRLSASVFLALVVATAVTTVFTFILFKYWVFSSNKE
ncbi:MAG: GtrA family protein [Candidatus Omnitrophica bacterium]|nr:GtrA family protein [Candidatus Omnitrophota bacterium]